MPVTHWQAVLMIKRNIAQILLLFLQFFSEDAADP
jgi:hypothetical protein